MSDEELPLFREHDPDKVIAQNHERFKAHLDASQEGVWILARWLSKRGHNVKINASGKAENRGDWKKFVDNGDLEVSLRVEVKQLSYHFTCREDWPFGENYMVCAQYSFDRAIPKPFAFYNLNPTATHAAQVLGSSRPKWTVKEHADRRFQDYTQKSYYCPLDHVYFFCLT